MGKRARQNRQAAARAAARREEAPPVEPQPRHVSTVPKGPGGGNARWRALLAVEEAAKREAAAIADRDAAVSEARHAGASWAEIGRALGVSRQAVRQRYGVAPMEGP